VKDKVRGSNTTACTTTTRNYLICDTFSATFSENVTNVHCSPKHCDDYDIFLFFVTDLHRSPKHYDDLLNSSRFYDVFLFFRHKHCDDLFSLSRFYDVFIFFRHGHAWMDIEAQTITTIC
jgi:hypothetical protein